jgi:hypothetical protein
MQNRAAFLQNVFETTIKEVHHVETHKTLNSSRKGQKSARKSTDSCSAEAKV